ncbi:hypothetical protein LCGC14_1705040 [marine sediment metagenome]|uniref:HNH domain-containing protein n=1 Tax=marine sediment metagenome TaxID=412755 RepID=A0A0F9JXE0_9ZZZZ
MQKRVKELFISHCVRARPSNPDEVISAKQNFYRVLGKLGFKSYADYLRGEHWAEFKERYYKTKQTRKRCVVCRITWREAVMHLHHTNYMQMGHESLGDVVPVCSLCHERIHKWHRKNSDVSLDSIGYVLKKVFSLSEKEIWERLRKGISRVAWKKNRKKWQQRAGVGRQMKPWQKRGGYIKQAWKRKKDSKFSRLIQEQYKDACRDCIPIEVGLAIR